MRKLALIYCLLLCAALSYNLGVHTAKAVSIDADEVIHTQPTNFSQVVGYFNKYSTQLPEGNLRVNGSVYCGYEYTGPQASILYNYLSSHTWDEFSVTKVPTLPDGTPLYTSMNIWGPDLNGQSCGFLCRRFYDVTIPIASLLTTDVYRFGNAVSYYITQLAYGTQSFIVGGVVYPCIINNLNVGETQVNVTLSFSLPNLYNVGRIAYDFPAGLGAEDIYGNSWQTSTLAFSTEDSLLYSGSLTQSTYFSLITLSDLSRVENFTFSLTSNPASTVTLGEDYGLRLLFSLSFNLYSYDDTGITDSVSSGTPDYQNCDWYDIPCHLGNALLYFLYVFPVTKGLFSLINGAYTFITETFGFIALWSGVGIAFAVVMTFIILRIIRYFTS